MKQNARELLEQLSMLLLLAGVEISRLKEEKAALLREIAAYQNSLGISADLLDNAVLHDPDPDHEED